MLSSDNDFVVDNGSLSDRLTSVAKGSGGSDIQYHKDFSVGGKNYRYVHIETGIGSNTTKTFSFKSSFKSKPYFATAGMLALKDLDECVLINAISNTSITLFQSNATTVRCYMDVIGEI